MADGLKLAVSPVSIQTQSLAFLAVSVYTTHATQAIAFEWKPGFSKLTTVDCSYHISMTTTALRLSPASATFTTTEEEHFRIDSKVKCEGVHPLYVSLGMSQRG